MLGLGISGKVVSCTHIKTQEKCALKILKDNVKSRREIDLHWRASGCKHIVNIRDVFENTYKDQKCLMVVMEWWVEFYVFNFKEYVSFCEVKFIKWVNEQQRVTFYSQFNMKIMALIFYKIRIFVSKNWILPKVNILSYFSMEGGELFNRIQDRKSFTEKGK